MLELACIRMSYECISAVFRQIRVLLVWRGVRCFVSSYVGIRIGGVGWHCMEGLWLTKKLTKNSWKWSKVGELECTWAFPALTRTVRFRSMAGPVGCVFHLILACTCFWPLLQKVLGCKKTMSNTVLRWELGMYPLKTNRDVMKLNGLYKVRIMIMPKTSLPG